MTTEALLFLLGRTFCLSAFEWAAMAGQNALPEKLFGFFFALQQRGVIFAGK